jgi:hypothetical protein
VKRLTRYTDATFERLAVAVMPDRFCKASCSNRSSLCVAIGVIAFALGVASAKAQEAEPRSYSNTPIGLNFLIGGYVYSKARWRSTRISRSPLRRLPAGGRAGLGISITTWGCLAAKVSQND